MKGSAENRANLYAKRFRVGACWIGAGIDRYEDELEFPRWTSIHASSSPRRPGCAPRISGSYARHDDLTTNLAWRTRSPSSGSRGAGAGPATFRDPRGPRGLSGNGAECESPRSRSLCAAPANALGPSGEGPRAPWPHSLQPAGASHADPTRAPLKGEQLHALARCVHYGRLGRLDQRDFERQTGAASCLLLILAAIIYWQIREIDRVLSEAGSDADDLNFELLSHISPIGWDNVLLYGEYQLNRSLVRSERLSV